MAVVVKNVIPESPGERCGIKAGDTILEINGREVKDYLDYMFLSANEEIEIKISDRTVVIINEDFEPLGLEFDSLLIDEPKSCRNKCVFCFIDQLPPNMRESCYFKDDDYRLSFLQGNYVTLTNMSDEDIDRIIEYNIPRINVSVHTTNPELRCKMLNNRFAGKITEQIRRFSDSGMLLNCQIVLCRGYNDGAELERTIQDLSEFTECIESLSIVPVGLTDYRDGLAELTPFDTESAAKVIDIVSEWQKKFMEELGINFVYLSDEFYIMAGRDIPAFNEYDGFPQIENGVGLCASLEWEFRDALEDCTKRRVKTKKTVVTGKLAFDFIKEMISELDGDKINVVAIENKFFGSKITVSGLVTGGDIITQLKGKDLGEKILIPSSMLRHDDDIFLDNVTVADVERELDVSVVVVQNDGYEFLEELLK